MDRYAVYFCEHYISDGELKYWKGSLSFYTPKIADTDPATDWRHREVTGKRKQAKFMGYCTTTFPVQYPLHLEDGTIIKQEDIK